MQWIRVSDLTLSGRTAVGILFAGNLPVPAFSVALGLGADQAVVQELPTVLVEDVGDADPELRHDCPGVEPRAPEQRHQLKQRSSTKKQKR